jgi:RNA polymerase-binding transcription factor DksA
MQNTHTFKTILEKELARIEAELKTVGRKNDVNPSDWEATQSDEGVDAAESGEVADNMEAMDNNTAVMNQLEVQLRDITDALKKIEAGTYGICEISGEAIEEDRLEANPSARTCKAHM